MEDDWVPAAAAEFVGTAVLVLFLSGAMLMNRRGDVGLVGVALVAGASYAFAVSTAGRASGGHVNPAVSVAAYLTKALTGVRCAVYVVAQLGGAVLGAALARSLLVEDLGGEGPGLAPVVGEVEPLTAVTLELLLTFVLATAMYEGVFRESTRLSGGLAVGSAAFLGTLVGFPFTGAAMNPARALGPALVSGVWVGQWVYVAGPVLGAALAGSLHVGFFSGGEESDASGASGEDGEP